RRNDASKLIGQAKAKRDEAGAAALMAEVAGLKDEIQKGEERERELKKALDEVLAGIPNLPAPDVPDGNDENDNIEVTARAFGQRPPMNAPREHYELGEQLGMMDFERAAKVSGSRFVYLTAGLARLERAVANFMLDLHTNEFGYTEFQPPVLVRDQAMFGTGQLPKFEDDLFFASSAVDVEEFIRGHGTDIDAKLQLDPAELASDLYYIRERHWLIPTAEVSLTNYVREEIL